MPTIQLPYAFKPRPYQLPFFRAMDGGKRRAVLVHHRRAGKDKSAFNYMVKEMFVRVGIYYYFFPTYNQGRKILWDGIDKDGFKFLDHIPKEVRKGDPNQTDMKINMVNGSLFQIVGSDNIDSIVGTNPVGCVFSEYPLQDPSGWDFVRPILRENGGWAVFPYTPRGKNHGWELYDMAKDNDDWHCELLTINETYGNGGTVGPDDVEAERKSGMSENLIQQEYYVSFDAAVENAVFGEQMLKCRAEKRITRVPHDTTLPVDTYWDIGRDGTAIWFTQPVRNEIRVIDYFISYHSDMPTDLAELAKKPYNYGPLHLPHDADHMSYKTKKTAKEIAVELGWDVEIVDKISEDTQIKAARMIFNRLWFDEQRCKKGIDALSSWHFGWDEKLRIMSSHPVHDWCFAMDTAVLTDSGWVPIQDISVHDQVLTPCGIRTILRSGIVRRTDKWITTRGIRSTPEHRFFTNRGLIMAIDLQRSEKFWTQDSWGLRILGLLCAGLRLGFMDAITSGIREEKKDSDPSSFIGWCTNLFMERFQMVTKSITLMMTRLITIHPTSKHCHVLSIAANTNHNRDTNVSARYVDQFSHVIRHSGQSAAKNAGASTTQGLKENEEPAYSLSVDKDECYFVRGNDGKAYLVANSSHASKALCYMALKQEDEREWRPVERYSRKPKRRTSAWAA